jgi:hypothetical protein
MLHLSFGLPGYLKQTSRPDDTDKYLCALQRVG